MLRQYPPLAAFSLAPYASAMLVRPSPNKVTLDSPAIEVMTDLSLVAAVTIESYASLVSANEYMIARGVRSLFVATPEGRVTGLITAADVLGERPVRVSHARGVRRNELVVADVMTPIDAVAAMRIEDVRAAKVGHIVASLTQAGPAPRAGSGSSFAGRGFHPRNFFRDADRPATGRGAANPRSRANLCRGRAGPARVRASRSEPRDGIATLRGYRCAGAWLRSAGRPTRFRPRAMP